MSKLSTAQRRVMKWLLGGWTAVQSDGFSVIINGQRVCNLDTIAALERKGLIEGNGMRRWRATEKAKREANHAS